MDSRKLSKKQKEYNTLMKSANRYAKNIIANPKLKEQACRILRVPSNKVYRTIIKEFTLRKGEINDLIKLK